MGLEYERLMRMPPPPQGSMRSSKGGGCRSNSGGGGGKNALARLIPRAKQCCGLGQALVILVMILPQMATDGKRSKGSEMDVAEVYCGMIFALSNFRRDNSYTP